MSTSFALFVILVAWIFQVIPTNVVSWLLVAWCIITLLEPLQPRRQGYQPPVKPQQRDEPTQSVSGAFPYQDEEEEVQQ